MHRRSFLGLAGGAVVGAQNGMAAAATPIIDTHIHLFDPGRPEGVPWPDKNNATLYKPALPDRYRAIAKPLGIVGAIEVEASPWLEDNQWVLDVAAKDSIIVGTIGNLEPGKPEFPKQLERFRRNPLFRGIRYGNLWGRDLRAELAKTEFVSGLKLLSAAGLTLDSANPNPALLQAIVKTSDLVPNLKIVVDHLPQMRVPDDATARQEYRQTLKEIGSRRQIYVKISEVFRRTGSEIPKDLSVYRDTLDEIFGTFGEDRVLYGSDWPNSDSWKPYGEVLGIVQEYFKDKSALAREKYFWRNSVKAYQWVKRDPSQPSL